MKSCMSDRYCHTNIQLLYYVLSCVKSYKVALTISIHPEFVSDSRRTARGEKQPALFN